MTEASISKGEREDLQRLIRQREKVLKSAAKQRSAELLADFENQMGSEFSYDQDEVWEQAAHEAEAEVRKAQQKIAARCQALGIPEQFAPSLSASWYGRGANAIKARRQELRTMAVSEIEAMERKAFTQIEMSCLEAQTQLAISGLTSQAARAFVEALPAVDKLMPALTYAELAGETNPPITEQLVTPNALRQRRYRDRQQALRNGQQALCNDTDDRNATAHADKGEVVR